MSPKKNNYFKLKNSQAEVWEESYFNFSTALRKPKCLKKSSILSVTYWSVEATVSERDSSWTLIWRITKFLYWECWSDGTAGRIFAMNAASVGSVPRPHMVP